MEQVMANVKYDSKALLEGLKEKYKMIRTMIARLWIEF
jgi:hypothetical protein